MHVENIKQKIEPTIKAFEELGFTRYESKILATLTALGTSTVKEIQQYTDVPLPKIYQTLQVLLQKGMVNQHSKTRPVQFTIYSPEIIARKIEEKNRQLESVLKKQLQHLNELTIPSFSSEIAPFNGPEALVRITRGVITNTKKQLSVAMSATTLRLFKPELLEAKKRGVQLRSIIFKRLEQLTSSVKREMYKELGFEHYVIPLPFNLKPNPKFFKLAKKIGGIIDYLGIIISDSGESVVLLPLFPHETFFGIWVFSEQIIKQQLVAYNELFSLAEKA
ncbi:MAG: TrmB family transcriptional regulator [Candidatus Heimdallarchaeota archaeon]